MNEVNKDRCPAPCSAGSDRLWGYFGLTYASWLTLPRVMCHQMPDEWQDKMAALMDEWDETWIFRPDFGTRVQLTKNGKLCKTPDWVTNYRHPDKRIFDDMKVNGNCPPISEP